MITDTIDRYAGDLNTRVWGRLNAVSGIHGDTLALLLGYRDEADLTRASARQPQDFIDRFDHAYQPGSPLDLACLKRQQIARNQRWIVLRPGFDALTTDSASALSLLFLWFDRYDQPRQQSLIESVLEQLVAFDSAVISTNALRVSLYVP